MSSHCTDRCALPRSPRGLSRPRPLFFAPTKRAVKRAAYRDCGRRCVACGVRLSLDVVTLDHVIPLSRGGNHASGNVVAACRDCNQLKSSMLPVEFFARYPWAGQNFLRLARVVHRSIKRGARRAVSLALAHGLPTSPQLRAG
ncbi:MAG: HNH endonuclease [Gemmatimonadaceae bacterium]|nr:HNH endonuclease [Gemmatimonadaceae bacterium]